MGNPNGHVATLKPWGPDNPPPRSPGRPRKRPLSEAYDDWLRRPVDTKTILSLREEGIKIPLDATNADLVAMQVGRQAIQGNVLAAKEMRESVEGKSTQRFEITPNSTGTQLTVIYGTAIPGEKDSTVIDMEPEPEQKQLPEETDGENKS